MAKDEVAESILLYRKQAKEALDSVVSLKQLEEWQATFLRKKSSLNKLFSQIPKLESKKREESGKQLNEIKIEISSLYSEKKSQIQESNLNKIKEDTTVPGEAIKIGHLHPTTKTIREINKFFQYYGYSVYTGPEIETNEYNFEKLNLPNHHPARDLADTLYIRSPHDLLRTHTSSVETRAMSNEPLPIRIVVPGKVFRNETSNATNNSMFYQYEGLLIDKNISLANLKGTLISFVQFLYGPSVVTRFRCKYYPQVEPGAGLDIQCTFCNGSGCPVCKHRGFIEVLGAGMVHPNVLSSCGIDPHEWSGFAFGLGLDRLVMLKYGISDIRKLYNGELVTRSL